MAQDASSTWLDAINVTGSRMAKTVKDSPRSVTVIGKEELEKKAPESIAEMLRDVPGIDLVDAGVAGMKRVRIRGEFSNRVTILVDGQEITDHSTYGTPFLVDPLTVERIDVIRGPASVLYGAKAIGGVINIITKKGGDKPVEAEISSTYFSATKGFQSSASLFGSFSGFDYRISGSLAEHGDRDVAGTKFSPTGKLDGSDFENDSLSGHFGYRFGASNNHYLSVKLEQHRLESNLWTDPSDLGLQPDGSEIHDFKIDLPQRDRKKVGLFYDADNLGPILKKIHIDGFYQTIDRLFSNVVEQTSGPTATPVPNFRSAVKVTSDDQIVDIGANAQIDLQLHRDHYVIFGAQYLNDELQKHTTVGGDFAPPLYGDSFTTLSDQRDNAEIRTLSFFAQDEWSIGSDTKVTGGLRYYHTEQELKETTRGTALTEDEDNKLLGSVGMTFTGIQNTTLRGLFSQGYVYPSLLQLYVPSQAGGQTIASNPDLKPETSNNYEVGARYDNGSWVFDGTAYYTNAKNYITTVPDTAAAPGSDDQIWDNADEATTYGIELLAQYTLPGTDFTPYVNGTYTRRELQFETFSTFNTNVPVLSARFGIKHKWTLGSDFSGWTDLYARAAKGVKETYLDSDGATMVTEKTDGWATLNLALGINYGEEDKYKLAVNFNNILNKAYRGTVDELPAAGRNVSVTARVKF